jgi:hypothetical protein
MGLSVRLVVKGYVGVVGQPARHITLSSQDIVTASKRRPLSLENVRPIRKDEESIGATIINPILLFPDTANRKDAWGSANGNTKYNEHPNIDTGGYALAWEDWAGQALLISDPAKYFIGINEAFTVRAFLEKPPGEYPIWCARWNGWQFQIIDGRAYIMKLAPTWSQSAENALVALQAVEEPTTDQLDTINELRASLYAIIESLGIEPGGDGWYGTAWTLTFYAEPRGAVTVFLGEGAKWQEQTIEVPDILKTRKAGTAWGSGPLTLASSAGTWSVQVGYPSHAVRGRILVGEYNHPATQDWQAAAKNIMADTPTGTTATIDIEDEPGVGLEDGTEYTNSKVYVSLTTSNPRLTPFFYGCDITIDPEPLGEVGETHLDTGDIELDDNPMMDAQTQFEGDMRRSQFALSLRDVNGRTQASILHRNEGLANHYCGLYVDGTVAMAMGVIQKAQISNVAKSEENVGTAAMRGDTHLEVEASDMWFILEETLLGDREIIGDDQYVGAVIRRGLKRAGIPEEHMAGVSATAGVKLDKAAFGEDWAHASADDQSVADYLRGIVEEYGVGWILYQNHLTGIWTYAKRSTSVAQTNGVDAAFTSGRAGQSSTTYPHRLRALAPLDLLRDTSDFYNFFPIHGTDKGDGTAIVHHEILWQSFTGPVGNLQSRTYIGRYKPHPKIYKSSIRTQGSAAIVGRSMRLRQGRPPRFQSFQTFYHKGLYPGDRITVDNIPCDIVTLSGSAKEDRMQVTAREVE